MFASICLGFQFQDFAKFATRSEQINSLSHGVPKKIDDESSMNWTRKLSQAYYEICLVK